MRPTGWFHGAAVLVLSAACGRGSQGSSGTSAPSGSASEARRVVIEVLNPSRLDGLARTATQRIREQPGLDVVYFGSARDSVIAARARNLIYVRRGDTTGVGRVIAAIGDADVVEMADPTRLVDLTVFPVGKPSAGSAH